MYLKYFKTVNLKNAHTVPECVFLPFLLPVFTHGGDGNSLFYGLLTLLQRVMLTCGFCGGHYCKNIVQRFEIRDFEALYNRLLISNLRFTAI